VWDLLVDLNLNPADIIFAGDSEVDIETAITSGCFPLGVSWGYRSRETIIKAGARHIIDKPEELLELL
jgi:phosphoglycolate phosphatase